jgi:hypothetical protein
MRVAQLSTFPCTIQSQATSRDCAQLRFFVGAGRYSTQAQSVPHRTATQISSNAPHPHPQHGRVMTHMRKMPVDLLDRLGIVRARLTRLDYSSYPKPNHLGLSWPGSMLFFSEASVFLGFPRTVSPVTEPRSAQPHIPAFYLGFASPPAFEFRERHPSVRRH